MTRRQWLGGGLLVLACAAGLVALSPERAVRPIGVVGPVAVPAPPPPDRLTAAREAARLRSEDPAAWSEVGLAAVEQARTSLDATRLDLAERALARSLELRPEANYDAVVGFGALANARHEFGAARDHGLRATAMAPERASAYAVLADAELELGHYPEATAATQRLLDLAPNAAALVRAAQDLQTHGRREEAVLALERALEAAGPAGERAFCARRLGDLAWEEGRFAEADGHYRQALAARPDDAQAAFGLARTAAAEGRTEEAARRLAELTARAPLPQFLLEQAELALATGHRAEAEGPLAALAAEARLAVGPADLHLARYLADHGDADEAVRQLTEEWERRTSTPVAAELAWALHRAGDDRSALRHARFVAESGGESVLAGYHRGVIELALGLPEGRQTLRAALDRNPRFSAYHADRARRLLTEGER
ncbi:tetratricopeptide repeat protein [Kitasatospora sp. NPDC051853]|uniref:tetratricopeptide repeat protein n=1 Tax=Kitasatospora sp. NPDC051853 TaxID=3364058 RepID=UPI003799E6ED